MTRKVLNSNLTPVYILTPERKKWSARNWAKFKLLGMRTNLNTMTNYELKSMGFSLEDQLRFKQITRLLVSQLELLIYQVSKEKDQMDKLRDKARGKTASK